MNGKPYAPKDGIKNISDLVKNLSYDVFAVSYNDHFLPRGEYGSTLIQQGDRIEIVVPQEGG